MDTLELKPEELFAIIGEYEFRIRRLTAINSALVEKVAELSAEKPETKKEQQSHDYN